MKSKQIVVLAALIALLLATAPSWAQLGPNQTITLDLTRQSPRAEIAQRVGLTDLRIVYHRPAVNEREIWGSLVPYDQVWRTGANENTLIHLSHDVMVEGQKLAAGTYGIHSIPGEEEWQIIFSKDNTAWGSFSYDESQDALRVTVKPEEAPHQERMSFSFDDPDNEATIIAIRWEKLRVPFKVEVPTDEYT